MAFTTQEKRKIAVFLEMAGVNKECTLSGPYAGAKSFINAVKRYSGHDITFFSTKVNDPELKPLIDTTNYFTMNDANLKELLDRFDAIHILNGKPTALRIGRLTNKAILGPNVVFGIPFIHPSQVKPEVWKEKGQYIEEENKIAALNWSYILTPNVSLENLMNKRLTGNHGQVIAMPYGLDTDTFRPREDHQDEKRYIVWIGAPNKPAKGVDLIEKVRALIPDEEWILLGKDAPFKYGEHIPYLQGALVFVSTSMHETQGLATLEAMACGAPLVIANHKYDAHDGEGYVEHKPHYQFNGKTAIVTPRDPKVIAAAIEDLRLNSKKRENLASEALAYVRDRFSLPAMARQYDAIITRHAIENEEGIKLPERAKKLRDAGKIEQSIADYNLLTASEPWNFSHIYFAGTAHMKKQPEEARRLFEQVLLMAPGHTSARNCLQKIEGTPREYK